MDDLIHSQDSPHDDAEALLPWYATGQLEAGDRALVESHLADCADCRAQLALERRLVAQFRTSTPQLDASWARFRALIEAPSARPSITMIATHFWAMLRRPGVAALAFTQLGFLVFGATVLMSLSRPDYRALESAPAPSAANVIVMFRADATEQRMRGALNASGASLVGGPTSANAYLVAVPAADRGQALARLQADRAIAMAQPIDGPSQ